jgi:hypothetical protein
MNVTTTGLAGPAARRRNRYFYGKTGGTARHVENSVYLGTLTPSTLWHCRMGPYEDGGVARFNTGNAMRTADT